MTAVYQYICNISVVYYQSAPDFIKQTVNCRCCLGEGNFDVVGFIQAVAKTGYNGPWGNEILSENVRRYPLEMMLPHIHNTSLAHIRNALDGTPVPRLIRADYSWFQQLPRGKSR